MLFIITFTLLVVAIPIIGEIALHKDDNILTRSKVEVEIISKPYRDRMRAKVQETSNAITLRAIWNLLVKIIKFLITLIRTHLRK